ARRRLRRGGERLAAAERDGRLPVHDHTRRALPRVHRRDAAPRRRPALRARPARRRRGTRDPAAGDDGRSCRQRVLRPVRRQAQPRRPGRARAARRQGGAGVTEGEQAPLSLGFLLWHATLRWQRLLSAALRPLGLTHVQFVLLAVLWWFTTVL